ncbi:4'-phosphopantetheinyl transferase family protein [Streptomyces hygroscopicus]|uniref:4'-phosphopantetheinyl transferase family protein n=1 Tax=Streptomyces hygroscopicus TaxID=1912 RepID=UPI001FCB807D|nr:4'-phosphopantetheinyl transferase superfamily protein [Streptomyces hygroscopicus]
MSATPANWSLPTPVAGGEQLDLWLLRLPAADVDPSALDPSALSARERQRGAAFRRTYDQFRYLSAHIGLRHILGGYLAIHPAEVTYAQVPCTVCGRPHGKPVVVTADESPLHFSLSHSGAMVAVAVATAPVGADVQVTPRPGTVEACIPFLHPREREELAAMPQEERRSTFGRLWTRKEAYLKGLGTGLSHGAAQKHYLGADVTGTPSGWTVRDIPCGHGHSAAIAIRGGLAVPVTVRRSGHELVCRGHQP